MTSRRFNVLQKTDVAEISNKVTVLYLANGLVPMIILPMSEEHPVSEMNLIARWRAIENVRIAWHDYNLVLKSLADNLNLHMKASIPMEMQPLQVKIQHDLFWRGLTTEILQVGEDLVLVRTERAA